MGEAEGSSGLLPFGSLSCPQWVSLLPQVRGVSTLHETMIWGKVILYCIYFFFCNASPINHDGLNGNSEPLPMIQLSV